MRLNKYLALYANLSRRSADQVIMQGRVQLNGLLAQLGQTVETSDRVSLDGQPVIPSVATTTIMLNKPVGYVCSRDGQGSKTVYDLLPANLHHLKPVGRLDKDSSGLLLLTNDGDLANRLTHPSFQKVKRYEVRLHKELARADFDKITKQGVQLEDGPSQFGLKPLTKQHNEWLATLHEGRNRQIRRTFSALGYTVRRIHRIEFGEYLLRSLATGQMQVI